MSFLQPACGAAEARLRAFRRNHTTWPRLGLPRPRTTIPSRPSRPGRLDVSAQSFVLLRGASMVAARVAAQFIIPARLLMVTATRAAGLRFVVAGLNVALVVLAAVVIFEKVFGLQKRLQRTLMAKETVLEQLDDTRNRQSMLELVLQKTRNNLTSLSSVDDDTDEDARGRASSSCPLCGGTGKIVYEGKMRHEDPCPRCALLGRMTR